MMYWFFDLSFDARRIPFTAVYGYFAACRIIFVYAREETFTSDMIIN